MHQPIQWCFGCFFMLLLHWVSSLITSPSLFKLIFTYFSVMPHRCLHFSDHKYDLCFSCIILSCSCSFCCYLLDVLEILCYFYCSAQLKHKVKKCSDLSLTVSCFFGISYVYVCVFCVYFLKFFSVRARLCDQF